jgi:hypothetical protein
MFAKLRKSDAVKEQNAKAMVPYKDNLAQIKEMAAELERQKTAEAGGTAGEVKLAVKMRNDTEGFAEEAEMEDLAEHSAWLVAVCEERDELVDERQWYIGFDAGYGTGYADMKEGVHVCAYKWIRQYMQKFGKSRAHSEAKREDRKEAKSAWSRRNFPGEFNDIDWLI